MSAYATLLAFHIVVGAAGLALGPVVAWADAHTWPHSRELGAWYLGLVVAVCISACALVFWRRTDLWWLVPVSALTVALALLGRYAVARRGAWTHA
ncbi:hypothetical protein [Nocardia sp. NPDC127526]|uniref:hypothetical protein n=1 Tax=Nocardia sp. NPDC127526 TaxID=3345393 RepID=UPI003632268E